MPDIRYSQITAKVVASSICGETGARLDTFQLRYPRMIHAEVLTHREKSKNSASSRAIPYASLTARDADIYVPLFRKNKPGMQPGAPLSATDQAKAEAIWRDMAAYVLEGTRKLSQDLKVHKQHVNRPLEWFGYIEVVMSATQWANFFGLRDHTDAQDEILILAQQIKKARAGVTPKSLRPGDWHLPYLDSDIALEIDDRCRSRAGEVDKLIEAIQPAFASPLLHKLSDASRLKLIVSSARCCRVSYSTHDGRPSTLIEDVDRSGKLLLGDRIHASPFEHQGMALRKNSRVFQPYQGNYRGYAQFRKFIPNEYITEYDT